MSWNTVRKYERFVDDVVMLSYLLFQSRIVSANLMHGLRKPLGANQKLKKTTLPCHRCRHTNQQVRQLFDWVMSYFEEYNHQFFGLPTRISTSSTTMDKNKIFLLKDAHRNDVLPLQLKFLVNKLKRISFIPCA
jgi:hypothetical protein